MTLSKTRTIEMNQKVKTRVTKPDNLSLIPRSHMVESRKLISAKYPLTHTEMQKVHKCNLKLSSKQIIRIYYKMKIYLVSHADYKCM